MHRTNSQSLRVVIFKFTLNFVLLILDIIQPEIIGCHEQLSPASRRSCLNFLDYCTVTYIKYTTFLI